MTTRTPRNASSSFALHSLESRRYQAVDLAVTSIQIIDGTHDATNEFTTAAITVTNFGNQAVLPKAIDLRLRFSVDDVFGNDDDWNLGYVNNPEALGAGESWTYTMERRATAQGDGSFRLIAYADGYDLITETNEDNNIMSSAADSVVYSSGELTSNDVYGTAFRDVILLKSDAQNVYVTMNGNTHHRKISDIPDRLFIDAGEGNDVIYADPDFAVKIQATGSTGHDRISGGKMNDELSGGVGMDRIWGRDGHDFLLGGGHNDWLYGEGGDDLGLGGGSNDSLYGGDGTNWLIGMNGNDRLFSKGNVGGPDTVSGNTGTDLAEVDPTDGPLAGIETYV